MMDMCNTCKFFESGECSKSVLCVNGSKYAPIKNKTGIDSVESARALCAENGIEL